MAASLVRLACALLILGAGCAAAPFEVNVFHGGAVSAHSKGDAGTYGNTVTKQRPVSKVIALMKDMAMQIEKEGQEDEEAYDKFACWCETNDKLKTKAIADAEQKIKSLTASIEESAATSAQLTTEIAGLEAAVAKGEHALAEATAVRDKELAEFNQQDKDAVVAITGLHSAVETLKKHNGGAAAAMLQVQHELAPYVGRVELRKLGLAARQRRVVASLLQQPVAASSYTAQSGEIFGVLASMKESFETNMASSRAEEEKNMEAFTTLKSAKTAELEAANKQLDSKSAEKAEADETHANSRIDLKDTQAQLEGDTAFLADLKPKCANMDSEWADRQKMRQDEASAVAQAIAILSDGDARDVVGRTTGFLQESMASTGRTAAAKKLQETALRTHNPKLALLAAKLQGGVFDKAIEGIKDQIKQLNKNKADEVKHRDYCVDELHKSSLATDALYHEKSNLETQKADLEAQIKRLTDEMAAARADIASMQIQMKKASEVRTQESKDFTDIIADQRQMQAIVGKAIAKLREFYDRKALLQTSGAQAQPEGFKPYVKEQRGGMAIGTLEHLRKDSYNVQKHSISQNMQSQLAYEEFMREQNKAIILLRTQIAEQTEEMSKADADLVRTDDDLHQNMEDLENHDTLNGAMHKECDFVMRNFDQRQEAMTTEVDSLYEAISMMSGHGSPEEKEAPAEAAPAV